MKKQIFFILFGLIYMFNCNGQTFSPYYQQYIVMKGIMSENHISDRQIIIQKDSIGIYRKKENGEMTIEKYAIEEKIEQGNTKNGRLDYNEKFVCEYPQSMKIEFYLVEDIEYANLIIDIDYGFSSFIYRVDKDSIEQKPFRFSPGTSWKNDATMTSLDIYYDNLTSKVYAIMKTEYNYKKKYEVKESNSVFQFYNVDTGTKEMFAVIKENPDSQRFLYFNGNGSYLKEIINE